LISLRELTPNRVLVTRESARALGQSVDKEAALGSPILRLDFAGIEGITPSFLDELMSVVEEAFQRVKQPQFRVAILKPPTQFSAKFAAIARGRELLIKELQDGSWLVEKGGHTPAAR